jgi:dolichol kinase
MEILLMYLIPCVMILIAIRLFTKLPSFIFRKLLHIVAFTAVTLMILAARSWQSATLTSIVIAVVVYPILAFFEQKKWYAHFFVQKTSGEIKKSLLLLFSMFAVLIAVCWGIFDKPEIAAMSIIMWGNGDAAAALIGTPFGRHKVKSSFADGKKSWEGSCAMLIFSFVSGFLIFIMTNSISVMASVLISIICAVVGTVVELFTPSEYDTVTVPAAIAFICLIIYP